MTRYIKADAVTVPQLNTELEKIEQAIQDTLSRKGDNPNAMEGALDMNSHRVINVPDAVNAQEPLTFGQYLLSKEESAQLKDAVFVDSIKDLASVNTAANNNVFVRGFYTGTGVGGGLFYWDPAKAKTEHNGGTVLDPARITAWDGTQSDLSTLFTAAVSGAGCFVRVYTARAIVEFWGAISSPEDEIGFDCFLSINKAFSLGIPLSGGGKNYYCTGYLNHTNIDISDMSITLASSATRIAFGLVSAYLTTTILSPVTALSNSLTLGSTEGIEPDDLIQIVSTEIWPYDVDRGLNYGEINQVLSVNHDSGVVTVRSPLQDNYSISEIQSITLRKPQKVNLENFYVTRPEPTNEGGYGIYNTTSSHSKINNIRVKNCATAGISIGGCYLLSLSKMVVINCYTEGTSTGYGCQINNSRNVIVKGFVGSGCRRAFDISGSIPSRYCGLYLFIVSGLKGGIGSCVGTHGTAFAASFVDGECHDASYGIQNRSPFTLIDNVRFSSNMIDCIIQSFTNSLEVKNCSTINDEKAVRTSSVTSATSRFISYFPTGANVGQQEKMIITNNNLTLKEGLLRVADSSDSGAISYLPTEVYWQISGNNIRLRSNASASQTYLLKFSSNRNFRRIKESQNTVAALVGDYERYTGFTFGTSNEVTNLKIPNSALSVWGGTGSLSNVTSNLVLSVVDGKFEVSGSISFDVITDSVRLQLNIGDVATWLDEGGAIFSGYRGSDLAPIDIFIYPAGGTDGTLYLAISEPYNSLTPVDSYNFRISGSGRVRYLYNS
jgi:hypothetical protein